MEYTFTTEYNANSMAAGAKARRKTLRKKRRSVSDILSVFVIGFFILDLIPGKGETFEFTLENILIMLAMAVIIITFLFEDKINGWLGYKRMVQGMSSAVCTFREENYISVTAIGTTIFNYSAVKAIARDNNYFIFLMDNNHVQLYDKSTMTGGTPQQFENFIRVKTDLPVVKI